MEEGHARLEAEVARRKEEKRLRLLQELEALDQPPAPPAAAAEPGPEKKPDEPQAVDIAAEIARVLRPAMEAHMADPDREEKVAAFVWREEIIPLLRASGLPRRFWYRVEGWPAELKAAWEARTGMHLQGWHRAQRVVFDRCRKHFTRKGAIVALVGVRGTGKTTIAAQLMIERAMTEKAPWDRVPLYRKLSDLIARFKPLYADHGSVDAESLMAGREAWAGVALKVVDELHECDDLRMKDRVLADLLDRCYSARTDVLIISNQKEQEFLGTTNDSILSRIAEHGEIIRCEWDSFRAKAEARRRAK